MMRRGRAPSLIVANIVLRKVVARRFSGLGRLKSKAKVFHGFLDPFSAICIDGTNRILSNVVGDMSFALVGIEMLAGLFSSEVNVFVNDW